jgi:hypothetical protein
VAVVTGRPGGGFSESAPAGIRLAARYGLPAADRSPGAFRRHSLAAEIDSDTVVPVVPRSLSRELVSGAPEFFKICRDQTYALCAVNEPLAEGLIICSCPITTADPDQATFGYQITGPYPCEDAFFENCNAAATNRRTGSTIPVGAPTGVPRLLTRLLDGPPVPPLTLCPSPGGE